MYDPCCHSWYVIIFWWALNIVLTYTSVAFTYNLDKSYLTRVHWFCLWSILEMNCLVSFIVDLAICLLYICNPFSTPAILSSSFRICAFHLTLRWRGSSFGWSITLQVMNFIHHCVSLVSFFLHSELQLFIRRVLFASSSCLWILWLWSTAEIMLLERLSKYGNIIYTISRKGLINNQQDMEVLEENVQSTKRKKKI